MGDSSKRVGKGLSAKCFECRLQGWQEANCRSTLGRLGHCPQWQHKEEKQIMAQERLQRGKERAIRSLPILLLHSANDAGSKSKAEDSSSFLLPFGLLYDPSLSPISTHPSHAIDIPEGRSSLSKPSHCQESCVPVDDLVAEYCV